jgi:thioredoxin 1
MNKKLLFATGIVIVIGIGAFAYSASRDKNSPTSTTLPTQQNTSEAPTDSLKGEFMSEGAAELEHGAYQDYSPAVVSSEQAAGRKIVLFFYATWCPECRAADAEFKSHPELVPAGVTLLKVDYDNNLELKKKYGVTYQHTFVQIDNNNNMITKWVSGRVDLLAKNIK